MGSAGSSRARRSVWAGSARNAARDLSVLLTSPPASVVCRRAWRRSRSMRQSARLVSWTFPPTSKPHPRWDAADFGAWQVRETASAPDGVTPPAHAFTAARRSADDAGSLVAVKPQRSGSLVAVGSTPGVLASKRSRRAPDRDRDMTSSHKAKHQYLIPERTAAQQALDHHSRDHSPQQRSMNSRHEAPDHDPTIPDQTHQITSATIQHPQQPHRSKHQDLTIPDQTTIESRHLLRCTSLQPTHQAPHICDVPASPKRHSFSQVRAFSLVGRGALFARISRTLCALSMLVMGSRGVYSRRFAVSVLRRADLLL